MTYDDYGSGGLIALYLVLLPILFIVGIAFYIVGAIFLMKVFEKAGVQGKWRAWVPVYNSMIVAKLGDLSPWVMLGAILVAGLLGQIPVIGWLLGLVGLAAWVLSGWRVGLKLGKDWPYLLLWLIPGVGTLIWLGILAFDKSQWNPNVSPSPWRNSFLKDTTVWQGIPVQPDQSVGGTAAPGAYPPPAGYQPPAGYSAPPAPPAGYTPPPAPPAAAPPAATPPAAAQPPFEPPTAPPAAPPAAPEPPTTPPTEPPAAPEPPRV